MNAIRFQSVNKILVFRTFFCPRTATLYFGRLFCCLQLELAIPNYINRKIETFKRFLMMQKNTSKIVHRNIVFVKVDFSVIETSESVHWSRRCYTISLISVWNKIFYWDLKEQSTKRHHVNIRFPKKTSATHWRGTVVLESK